MTNRKRDFRWAKWVVVFILVAIAVVVAFLIKKNYFDKKNDINNQVSSSVDRSDNKKPEEKPDNTEEEILVQKEEIPQYAGDSPNKAETLTGVISYAGVSNNNLVVRVNIDQFLEDGSCKIDVIKDGNNIYTQTVPIQESVTTSTCNGFDIPVTQLTNGNLQIEVTVESGSRSGKMVGEVNYD